MEQLKELVNNIRHVLVNESFKLFARENVIDLDHLTDLHVTSLSTAGLAMMSDEFQEQFKILMDIYMGLSELIKCSDDNGNNFDALNEQFKPYGFVLNDIPAMEHWKHGEETLVSSVGITVLECKPFSFVVGRFT